MNAVLEETVLDESILDETAKCDVAGCSHPADYSAKMRCCRRGGIMCDRCVNIARERVASRVILGGPASSTCVHCHTPRVIRSFDELVAVDPI